MIILLQEATNLRRGIARRWTSLKQHPRPCTEPLVSEGGGSTPSTATASPLPEVPRKSNWQVIEHFGSKDKGSLSSSLIAVSKLKCQPVNILRPEHFFFLLMSPARSFNFLCELPRDFSTIHHNSIRDYERLKTQETLL